jgi:hypothetical protein
MGKFVVLEKGLEIGGYLERSDRGRVGHDIGHDCRKESLQLEIEGDKKTRVPPAA